MYTMRMVLAAGLALALSSGCSDDTKPTTDGGGKLDKGPCTLCFEGGVPEGSVPDKKVQQPEGGMSSALQAVINKLTLPKSNAEYTHDYDGSGAKNQFGAVVGALSSLNLGSADMQTQMNTAVTNGYFITLLDVMAASITDAASMTLQAYQGEDLDSPPKASDNFSGSEPLGVKPGTPMDMTLPGSIASSKMTAGPGDITIPFPAYSIIQVPISKTIIEAELSSTPTSAMKNGRLYGAVPWTAVEQQIIPDIAKGTDETYKHTSTSATLKAILKATFDADGNGTITATEVKDSALLKLILKADIDTNGDSTPDAMSMGVAFTAVKCEIKK